MTEDQPRAPGRDPEGGEDGVHLSAEASDHAQIYQAGRDMHVHHRHGLDVVRRVESPNGDVECPYPGLAAFGAEQAQWFFGRDKLLAEVVQRAAELLDRGGLLMVVAPSGAGKSSLLRAGLLSRIAHGALPVSGSAEWRQLVFTPTAQPLAVLVKHLAEFLDMPDPAVARMVVDSPDEVIALLRRALADQAGGPAARLVVVVDQLEELFTLCTGPVQWRDFVGLLVRMSQRGVAGEPPVAVVACGLRSDFYTPCADVPELRDALQRDQVFVGAMSTDELSQVILFPAQAVGLDVELALVDELLRDLHAGGVGGSGGSGVRYEAGRLPLLAHALRATWQQRHGHTLTVAGYRTTGGIQRAVATTAERVFGGLSPAAQEATRRVFLRLVAIGDSGDGFEDTRRRATKAEMDQVAGDPGVVAAVVDAFTEGRLLTREQDTIEITHEALLWAWPRLLEWINADRAGSLLRQQVEQAAAAWDHDRGDTSTLLRGARLDTARAWADDHPDDVSQTAAAFLQASRRQYRRARRVRRVAIASLATLSLVASVSAVIAFQQGATAQADSRVATEQRNLAIGAEADALRPNNASLAAQLDVAVYRLQPSPDLRTRLITDAATPLSTPLTGHTNAVNSVAFSPDGHVLVSGSSAENAMRLWNVSGARHPMAIGQPLAVSANSLAFSPRGHILATGTTATGTTDGTIQLRDLSDPRHPVALGKPLTGSHTGTVDSVAFSPDGRILASDGGADHTIRLWDVSDPANAAQLGQPWADPTLVNSLAFSPDGHTLASGDNDKEIRLWDVSDPHHVGLLGQPITGHTDGVSSVAFSPDGRTLASGSSDQTIRLWDVSDPRNPTSLGNPLIGGIGNVFSVVFSPDGRTLAGGGNGNTIRLWDVADPGNPATFGPPLTGSTGIVFSLAFSPDGRTLASGSGDQTIRLWTMPPTTLIGHTSAASSVAFSPDGRTLASGGNDRTVRLWDVSDPQRPKSLGPPLVGPNDSVRTVAFSPDGHSLVSGGNDGVWLWDVSDPRQPIPLGQPPGDPAYTVSSVAFSPDGRILAANGGKGGVWLWDVSNHRHPALMEQPPTDITDVVGAVVFSPVGRIIAVGGTDSVRLWDVSEPRHPTLLGQLPGFVYSVVVNSVAFSPDGRTLAGSDANTIRLWDVSNPRHPVRLAQTSSDPLDVVNSVAFSPDGRTLASSGNDRTVRLWDVSDPHHPVPLGQPLTGHTDWVSSVAFSPDGATLASGGDETIRLWSLNIDEDIQRICAATANNLGTQQWQKYLSGVPYNASCR